jgi:hypothetical protein
MATAGGVGGGSGEAGGGRHAAALALIEAHKARPEGTNLAMVNFDRAYFDGLSAEQQDGLASHGPLKSSRRRLHVVYSISDSPYKIYYVASVDDSTALT